MKRFFLTFFIPAAMLLAKTEDSVQGYSGYFADQLAPCYFHPEFHWAVDFSDYDRTITIEDGSIWKIPSSDYYYLSDWKRNDPLSLEYSFFPGSYTLHNRTDRKYTKVRVTLVSGPVVGAEFARQICNIDALKGLITLSDRTQWQPSFFSECRDWTIGDYIIVAQGTWTQSVLLNVNLNKETYATLRKWTYGTTR